ncbi:Uncharacterized protein SVXHr_0333 [Halorhabdus sp. SVX81]|uniref:DUF7115 domain-containing protein n=1 Tax=Halorhabdus sp. SVX81 TaxID=2978283 RepID=UPI0023D9F4DF|nr:hypothetical protein [Halorhabdus sp. SVX81]WEL16515.1 Uncharacterized protein SVXHr_0333 [Halorhabdus sp. SVX81]
MEIPDLVHEELGGEEIRSGVAIGDEEVVCATDSRTLIYRPEGILSDERIEQYPHDVDRLALSEGRRKTTFKLTYVDGTRSFAVPASHGRDVLTLLLEGILGVDGVLDEDESVVGAFRFSELTLVIAENRLVRHIGETVWDDDFTQYEYADLTGLDFQEGSVATEIVLTIDGRPQRIKTPREDARLVEETLKKAVFEFYEVATMAELQRAVETAETGDESSAADEPDDLTFGSGIDPLVSETGDEPSDPLETDSEMAEPSTPTEGESTTATQPSQSSVETPQQTTEQGVDNRSDPASTAIGTAGTEDTPSPQQTNNPDRSRSTDATPRTGSSPESTQAATEDDVEALREEVSELSSAVQRQNQLLKKQHNAIKQLFGELRDQ